MKRLSAAALAAFCYVLPASADECRSRSATVASAEAKGGQAVVVTAPHAIDQAVRLYNALPGEQLSGIDVVVVVSGPRRGGALFFGIEDRICRVLAVPRASWPDVRAMVLGIEV